MFCVHSAYSSQTTKRFNHTTDKYKILWAVSSAINKLHPTTPGTAHTPMPCPTTPCTAHTTMPPSCQTINTHRCWRDMEAHDFRQVMLHFYPQLTDLLCVQTCFQFTLFQHRPQNIIHLVLTVFIHEKKYDDNKVVNKNCAKAEKLIIRPSLKNHIPCENVN